MPDQNGNLSQEELDKATAFLNGLWQGRVQQCPICGEDKWQIAPQLIQPLTLDGNWSPNLGLPGYPSVMVISPKCGYTLLFNAVIVGLIPRTEPPKT